MTTNTIKLAVLLTAVSSGFAFASADLSYEPTINPEYAPRALNVAPSPLAPGDLALGGRAVERLGMNFGMGATAAVPAPAAMAASAAPQSAAQADVQAMIAPKEAIVPAGMDVSKMSGDQASGAGEAIMDRVLNIKGTPASGSAAGPVAGSMSAAPSQLKRARRGPFDYALWAPIKIVNASTDYLSKKTGMSPTWASLALSAVPMAGMLKAVIVNGALTSAANPVSHGSLALFLGSLLMAVLFLGKAKVEGRAEENAKQAKKMNDAVAKNQAAYQAVPGVVGLKGETISGSEYDDHLIIVQVKTLSADNINKIPQKIDGFKTKVQFVR